MSDIKTFLDYDVQIGGYNITKDVIQYYATRFFDDNLTCVVIEPINYIIKTEEEHDRLFSYILKTHDLQYISDNLNSFKNNKTVFYNEYKNVIITLELDLYNKNLILRSVYRTNDLKHNASSITEDVINYMNNNLTKPDYTIRLDSSTKDSEYTSKDFYINRKDFLQPPDIYYPYINCGLSKYFEEYLESSSNILLLKGPPGTGKTSFLKALLNYSCHDVVMTYDEDLLNKDYYFTEFLYSKNRFLVIEDSDKLLTARSEGNAMVSKILNISDGITPTDKKIIFTTNLPNIRDIDTALIRPGRCFDILEFKRFSIEEGNEVAKHIGLEQPIHKELSLAEIYNLKESKQFFSQPKSMGF